MAHMAGQFAGILRVEVDVQQREGLIVALDALEKLRLETVIHPDSGGSDAVDGPAVAGPAVSGPAVSGLVAGGPVAGGPVAGGPVAGEGQQASGQSRETEAQELESQLESQHEQLGEDIAGGLVQSGASVCLELVGQDQPGIVREVTRVLAESSVNVEELQTERTPAPGTGQLLFRATARLQLPVGVSEEALRQALEQVAADLMVDLRLHG